MSKKTTCLSATSATFYPDDFPMLAGTRSWDQPLTPKIMANLLKVKSDENSQLIQKLSDSQRLVVQMKSRAQWLETKKDAHRLKVDNLTTKVVGLERDLVVSEDRGNDLLETVGELKDSLTRVNMERANENRASHEKLIKMRNREEAASTTARRALITIHEAHLREQCESVEAAATARFEVLRRDLISDHEAQLREHRESVGEQLRHMDQLVASSREEVRNLRVQDNEWIGRTLKLKFIFDEIEKLCVLPQDHAEWIQPMVEDIVIPEVPRNIRNQFLPSYGDAHMEDDGAEQEEIYASLSREATAFSELIGDRNPNDVMKAVIIIQKFSRGMIIRRIYGDNPVKRIQMATVIQKIYRGWNQRGMRLLCLPEVLRFRSMYPPRRVTIKFINTGVGEVRINWININTNRMGSPTIVGNNVIGGVGPDEITERFPAEGMQTYVGHIFKVVSFGGTKYIRIPLNFENNSYFDVATGFTFTKSHWIGRAENMRPAGADRAGALNSTESSLVRRISQECNCETCRERRRRQAQVNELEEQQQLEAAIQLSLDFAISVAEQADDYSDSLVALFNA